MPLTDRGARAPPRHWRQEPPIESSTRLWIRMADRCMEIWTRYYAFVTKAMLVHRAKWGSRVDVLEQLYGPRGQGQHAARRDNIVRLLGYGFPDIKEALACTPHRATLLGYGTISAREAKVHRIPLPPGLKGITEPRKVTVTVAWLSPVNWKRSQAGVRAVDPSRAGGRTRGDVRSCSRDSVYRASGSVERRTDSNVSRVSSRCCLAFSGVRTGGFTWNLPPVTAPTQ